MLEAKEIIIISDLHISAEHNRGLFRADHQLATFLEKKFIETHQCLLVLNGDIFDFLVHRTPGTSVNAQQAAAQIEAIIYAKDENEALVHERIFDALRRWGTSKEHTIVIIGGNHDPELIFPEVRQVITKRLSENYSPSPIQWLVNGEALSLRFGAINVLIEHGDQYDDWNFIDHEALRRLICLNSRSIEARRNGKPEEVYKPPPGSQLVVNRLNAVRSQFPWIEQLQPFNEAVLPLIIEFVFWELDRNGKRSLGGVVKERAKKALRSFVRAQLRERLNRKARFWISDNDRWQRYVKWEAAFKNERKWGGSEKDFSRMIERLRKVAGRPGFFNTEVIDEQAEDASLLIELGHDLVIHGHTHSAKAYRLPQSTQLNPARLIDLNLNHENKQGLYMNSGTWGQLIRLPQTDDKKNSLSDEENTKEWSDFLHNLIKGESDSYSFQRPTFIHVANESDGVRADLCEWQDQTTYLGRWIYTDNKWKQRKEN